MQLYCHPAKSTGEGLQDVNGGRLCTQAEVARWPVVSEGRATLDVLKRLYVWCVSGDAISLCNYKKHRSVIKHIDLRSTEEHIDYACEAINEKYNIVSYRVGLPTALANLKEQCTSAVIGAGLIDALCRLRAAIARRKSQVS